MKTSHHQLVSFLAATLLSGCGGSSGKDASTNINQVGLPDAIQITKYSDTQIIGLGTSINQLSDAALGALSVGTNLNNPAGQIESITADQIASLSPAQVQIIGINSIGGTPGVSQIAYLNSDAWKKLVSYPGQVQAMSAIVIPNLSGYDIAAIGPNFNQLSEGAIAALTFGTNSITNPIGQIESITSTEISTLVPAQVRLIGAAGADGAIRTSKIRWLNSETWLSLMGSGSQVAAITADEIPTLSDPEIIAIGTNLNRLSNDALAALTFGTNSANPTGQIESITASQISVLSPVQVQLIGAAVPGGSNAFPQIRWLNSGAWQSLVNDPNQVLAMSPDEIPTFSDEEITAMGSNINQLRDASLAALTYGTNSWNPVGQIESLTAVQIASFSPIQINVLASIAPGTAIAYLNIGAFGSLSGGQVSSLLPQNITGISPQELASLPQSTLAFFLPDTVASFTSSQKALLSSAQHAACNC